MLPQTPYRRHVVEMALYPGPPPSFGSSSAENPQSMTMADERRVQTMPGNESTETGSDGLVTALSRRQLFCVLKFVGFVVVLTWARRRAGPL